MVESKSLEKFEFVTNPEESAWKQFADMTNKTEGWVIGKQDYWCLLNALGSENVRFIAVYDKESLKLVAGIVALTHVSIDGSPHMSNIWYYYVLPRYRGIGLGLAACDKLVKSKQIASGSQSLSSAPEMTHKYANKFNFKKILDWKISHYSFETTIVDIDRLISEEPIPNVNIIYPQEDPENVPWQQVFEYDRLIQGGVRRDSLLRCFLTLGNNSIAKIAYDFQSQKVIGIGCVRETFDDRLLFGPFYADTPALAQKLLYELLLPYTNVDSKITTKQLSDYKALYIMAPSTNQAALDLINKLAGKEVPAIMSAPIQFTDYVIDFPVNRMYCAFEFI